MTEFATPEPTWYAMVAALDEEPSDDAWAFKLAIQCREHLRHALRNTDSPASVAAGAFSEWTRDPGKRPPRRTEGRTRRTGKDIPGGPGGPGGYYQRWHVLLGVLIGHEFEDARHDTPPWTRRLRMEKDWVIPAPQLSDGQIRSSAPEWLTSRGIYVHKRFLTT